MSIKHQAFHLLQNQIVFEGHAITEINIDDSDTTFSGDEDIDGGDNLTFECVYNTDGSATYILPCNSLFASFLA